MAAMRKKGRLRAKPLWHLVPNMFTIMSLGCGLTAMRYALDDRWRLAVALIAFAAIFDALDGRAARLLKQTSKLGEQLDSLSDFVSFGVVPAVIVYLWTLHDVKGIGWALALLFAACCAMRLARFNTEIDAEDKPHWAGNFFTGIPAPAAAGLALLPMTASFVIGDDLARAWILNALMMLFVAAMMVSRVPTFSGKKLKIKPEYTVPLLLATVMILVFLATETWLTLTLIGLTYLITLPVGFVIAKRMQKTEPRAPTDEKPSEDPDGRVVPLEKRNEG